MNDSIIFYTDEILNIETYWDLKNKSAIIPYLTSNEIISISNPFEGLIVFDRILQEFFIYKNSVWIELLNIGGGNITYQDVIDALGYTPENVQNKVTTIIPELINNTEYPTTSAVFNYIAEIISTKFDIPTGTESDYLDGTGTPTPFPTMLSADKMITIGRNSTGDTLYKGTIIYLSGSTGNRPNFVKAQANTEGTSARTFGVILNDIPNNTDGNCVTIGTIDNLDTRSTAPNPFTTDTLLDGDTIYLSPTNAGYVTRVKPSAPNHLVYIGKVVRTSPTNGTIVYQIQNGFELDEIHDVQIQTLQNNDLLLWDSATSLWKNKQLTSGIITTALGYTPQSVISLTTVGSSGAATFSGNVLNIPNYSLFSWNLLGNSNTNPTINFIGTTDNQQLVFRTNNVERLRIFSNGNIAIGFPTDAGFKLDVNGTSAFRGNMELLGQINSYIPTDNTLTIRTTGTTTISRLLLISGNATTSAKASYISFVTSDATSQRWDIGQYGNNNITIRNVTGSTTPLTLTTNGRLLLGTTTESTYLLDVNGAGRIQSTLKIGANTTQNLSAVLDVESTTKGFLPPRMTSAQRTAISTPAIGLIVYQTDGTEGVYVNTSTGWKQLLM